MRIYVIAYNKNERNSFEIANFVGTQEIYYKISNNDLYIYAGAESIVDHANIEGLNFGVTVKALRGKEVKDYGENYINYGLKKISVYGSG